MGHATKLWAVSMVSRTSPTDQRTDSGWCVVGQGSVDGVHDRYGVVASTAPGLLGRYAAEYEPAQQLVFGGGGGAESDEIQALRQAVLPAVECEPSGHLRNLAGHRQQSEKYGGLSLGCRRTQAAAGGDYGVGVLCTPLTTCRLAGEYRCHGREADPSALGVTAVA